VEGEVAEECEELWFVARWISGWQDWETAAQHLARVPLTPAEVGCGGSGFGRDWSQLRRW